MLWCVFAVLMGFIGMGSHASELRKTNEINHATTLNELAVSYYKRGEYDLVFRILVTLLNSAKVV
jgi:hypothetical protein